MGASAESRFVSKEEVSASSIEPDTMRGRDIAGPYPKEFPTVSS